MIQNFTKKKLISALIELSLKHILSKKKGSLKSVCDLRDIELFIHLSRTYLMQDL